jgi:hypothetical protein
LTDTQVNCSWKTSKVAFPEIIIGLVDVRVGVGVGVTFVDGVYELILKSIPKFRHEFKVGVGVGVSVIAENTKSTTSQDTDVGCGV